MNRDIISVLVHIVITLLISFLVSVAVVKYHQNSRIYYVFDLQKAVTRIKKLPDFERKLLAIEQQLNTYSQPVFIRGAILNMKNQRVEDITDEVLAEIMVVSKPMSENRQQRPY